MTDALASGLLELWNRFAPRLGPLRVWLGSLLQPPDGVEVYVRDGSTVTGVLFVNDGFVVGIIGFRGRIPRRRDVRWADDPPAWDHWDGR